MVQLLAMFTKPYLAPPHQIYRAPHFYWQGKQDQNNDTLQPRGPGNNQLRMPSHANDPLCYLSFKLRFKNITPKLPEWNIWHCSGFHIDCSSPNLLSLFHGIVHKHFLTFGEEPIRRISVFNNKFNMELSNATTHTCRRLTDVA